MKNLWALPQSVNPSRRKEGGPHDLKGRRKVQNCLWVAVRGREGLLKKTHKDSSKVWRRAKEISYRDGGYSPKKDLVSAYCPMWGSLLFPTSEAVRERRASELPPIRR